MSHASAMRHAACLCALALLLLPALAAARPAQQAGGAHRDPAHAAAAILRDAARALEAGESQRAADLARGVLSADLPAVDRAEAWRLHGLASFFLGHFDQAESSFLAYLEIEPDGRLDPALVPPEAIVFFEDVRARHAADLHAYRPKPRSKRYWALNLLPPAGQFQNGHHTKAWVLAGTGAFLLATNIGTYWTLRQWCDPATGVCASGGESRAEAARILRVVNLSAGALLLGTLAYGIFDGFLHDPDDAGGGPPHSRTVSVGLCPGLDCGHISLYKRF